MRKNNNLEIDSMFNGIEDIYVNANDRTTKIIYQIYNDSFRIDSIKLWEISQDAITG